MFKSGAQMMILVLLAGLVLMRESRHEPLASWDDQWADFLATTSRQAQKEAPLMLVGIDDGCLQEHPWPWSPLDFSNFFQAALPHQPAVVAIDEVLDWDRTAPPDWQEKKQPLYEKFLLERMRLAPRMLLGAQLGFPADPQVAPPWQEVPLLRQVKGDASGLPDFPIVDRQPSEEFRLAATIGFTNLPAVHERYNSVPLLFRHHGQVVPSFPLQAMMMWARLTPDEVTVKLGSHIDLGRRRRVPINAHGRMRVDFAAPHGKVSYDDLLLATEQAAVGARPAVDLSQLKGRIVLLSRLDSPARKIPLAARRAGSQGELFAAAIATMQNQSFIRRASVGVELLILAALAGTGYFVVGWTRFSTLAVGFVSLTAYVLMAMAVFNRWLIWLPAILPAGTMLCLIVFRALVSKRTVRPRKPVIL